MKSLVELLDVLDRFEPLHKAKAEKVRIETHPTLLEDYLKLTQTQKQLVRQTVQRKQPQTELLKNRQAELEDMTDQLLVQTYLTNLEECQELADAISEILSQECTKNQSILL